MFGNRKVYTCPKCHKTLMVNGDAKIIRCPSCQLQINPADSGRTHQSTVALPKTSVKTQGMAKYVCSHCGHSYLFDSYTHEPMCPRCKSGAADPKSPAARVIAAGYAGTKKQRKQQKYEARSLRMLNQMREHKSIVVALLAMMNAPASLRQDLTSSFDRVIVGLEQEQKGKMRRYEEAGE